jgi:uncharacterized protein (DUF2225 family)
MKHGRVAACKQNIINIDEEIKILVPSDKINREVSTLEAMKPIESKKSLKRVYHAVVPVLNHIVTCAVCTHEMEE